MISINLLDNRRKEIIKRQALLAKLNIFGFGFLLIAILVSAGIGGVRFFYARNLTSVESKNTTLQAQIKTYSDVFESMDNIRAKLDSINTILESKDLALKKLGLFFNLYKTNLLEIRNVGLGGASNPLEFEVTGRVASIGEFVTLHEYVRDLSIETNEFDQVFLRSLSRDDQGFYSFNYLIIYKELTDS